MDELKHARPSDKDGTFTLTGYHAVADGGEGVFVWAEPCALPADDAVVVKPDGYGGEGKWVRITDNALVNVKWFGAYGDGRHDDTKAIQTAIDNENDKEVFIPAGEYKISQTLRYITTGYHSGIQLRGAGERTVIDFAFADNTPLLLIDGASAKPYQFQRGGYIKDMQITSRTKFSANTQGDVVNITGWWLGQISGVVIRNCYGNGIVSPLRANVDKNPDAYASVDLSISSCEISFIDGVGILEASGLGAGGWRIIQNRIGECKGGGIVISGHNTVVESNAIFSNGFGAELKPGLIIERVQTNPMNTFISDNEFDNNASCHILLNGSVNTLVQQNRMNSWETVAKTRGNLYPPVHVLFNTTIKGAQNINAEFKYNYHRSQHATSGGTADLDLTLYDFQTDPNNATIEVINPFIPVPDNTPKLKVTNMDNDQPRKNARSIKVTLKGKEQ